MKILYASFILNLCLFFDKWIYSRKGGWFDGIKHPTIFDLQIILKLELNSRHFYIICTIYYILVMPKKIKLCNEYEKKITYIPPTSMACYMI